MSAKDRLRRLEKMQKPTEDGVALFLPWNGRDSVDHDENSIRRKVDEFLRTGKSSGIVEYLPEHVAAIDEWIASHREAGSVKCAEITRPLPGVTIAITEHEDWYGNDAFERLRAPDSAPLPSETG